MNIRHASACRWYRVVVLCMLATQTWAAEPSLQTIPGEDRETLTIGYSAGLFKEVDVNDARAATQIWLRHMLQRSELALDARAVVLPGDVAATQAIREQEVDVLVLLPTEYLEVREQVDLVPMAIPLAVGQPGYEYGLLCRVDRSTDIAGLRGADVLIASMHTRALPQLWLDRLLGQHGQPDAARFFTSLMPSDNPGGAVLQVFFGKVAASVVSLATYGTMVELNPQLGRELHVLAESPLISPSVICATRLAYERYGETLEDAFVTFHADPEGSQVLSLFGVDQLVPFREAHLDPVRQLLSLGHGRPGGR